MKYDILRKITIFKYLSDSEIDVLANQLTEKNFDEAEVVVQEKNNGHEMYIIIEGEAQVLLHREDTLLVLAKLSPGGFFGDMSLLTDLPRSATVKTLTKSKMLVFKKELLEEIMEKFPSTAAKFLKAISEELCERIQSTNENVETLFLINKAIVDNEQFRRLYIGAHKQTPFGSSSS
ncbi:cyclic nucleotide-binding domain-containing protein [candidate division WOR-3 bacterium]|nr:cyclic nucleotide-binding domain-containing protein [candidate division WOR-3 bacterium]